MNNELHSGDYFFGSYFHCPICEPYTEPGAIIRPCYLCYRLGNILEAYKRKDDLESHSPTFNVIVKKN